MIVKQADDNDDYEKKKNIIIGTVVGGVGLLCLVAIACYCFHRKRARGDGEDFLGSIDTCVKLNWRLH